MDDSFGEGTEETKLDDSFGEENILDDSFGEGSLIIDEGSPTASRSPSAWREEYKKQRPKAESVCSSSSNSDIEEPDECEVVEISAPTRVVIETKEESNSVVFDIDRVGKRDDGQQRSAYDEDDVTMVGALDNQPCSSSSMRNLQYQNQNQQQQEPYQQNRNSRWGQVTETDEGRRELQWELRSPYGDQDYRTNDRGARNVENQRSSPLYEVEKDLIISDVHSIFEKSFGGSKLDGKKKEAEELPKPPVQRKNTCWNCEEDHMITACPKPRNPSAIAQNRKKFMDAKQKRNGGGGASMGDFSKQRRYCDEPTSVGPGSGGNIGSRQFEENYKPGILSEDLRRAMNLERWELPMFIYRMRIYGYPPGWLENAMEESSPGLKLYGNDMIGMEISNPKKKSRINPDNIISFPGFNVPIPYGVNDESVRLNMPRQQRSDSIQEFLHKLNAGERDDTFMPNGDRDYRPKSREGEPLARKEDFKWEFNSDRLDEPTINSGARFGVGRGNFRSGDPVIIPGTRGPIAQPKRKPLPVEHVRKSERKVVEETHTIDERYLPRKTLTKRRNCQKFRSNSPSLLPGDGSNLDETEIEGRGSDLDTPVILNLPLSTNYLRKPVNENSSDGGTTTGSSSYQVGSGSPERSSSRKERKRQNRKRECSGSMMPNSGDESKKAKMKPIVQVLNLDDVVILSGSEDDADPCDLVKNVFSNRNKIPSEKEEGECTQSQELDDSDDSICILAEDEVTPPAVSSQTRLSSATSTLSSSPLSCSTPTSSQKSGGSIPTPKSNYTAIEPGVASTIKNTTLRETGIGFVSGGRTSKKAPDVVELESSSSEYEQCDVNSGSGSDWETESKKKKKKKRRKSFNGGVNVSEKPLPGSPGSSTGDEEFGSDNYGKVKVTYKKKNKGFEEENWEDEAMDTQSQSTQEQSKPIPVKAVKEFVPSNPRLDAIKKVFLSHATIEIEGDEDSQKAFKALPSFEKFAHGMPEMVFEEEPSERTGRLDRVLGVLKKRKTNNNGQS